MPTLRNYMIAGFIFIAAFSLSACSGDGLSAPAANGSNGTVTTQGLSRTTAGPTNPSPLATPVPADSSRPLNYCPPPNPRCPTPPPTPKPTPTATPTQTPVPLPTTIINIRNYITQPLTSAPNGVLTAGTGKMMCNPSVGTCYTGFYRNGEFEYMNSPFGVDSYYAEFSVNVNGTPVTELGIVRSAVTSNGSTNLRCFSIPGNPCTAPPTSNIVPEALPVVIALHTVPYSTELATENNGTCCIPTQSYNNVGSPKTTIPGAISPTGPLGTYLPFQNNTLNPITCAQTSTGSTFAYVTAILVTNVPFGGTVGTQTALVVDEYELGPSTSLNHMERYYYVQGYGMVRSSASQFDPLTNVYDLWISGNNGDGNFVDNVEETNTFSSPASFCQQNSSPPLD